MQVKDTKWILQLNCCRMTDGSFIPNIADSNSVIASTSNTEEQGATDDVILQQQHQKQGSPERLLPQGIDQRVVTVKLLIEIIAMPCNQ